MLYGYLIPISLYVSNEVVKVLQACFINQHILMYDETQIPAQARTSNLNEELGQVHTILSDKTGILTCNQMDFLKCFIAGTAYGSSSSDIELAAEQQLANDPVNKVELEAVVSSLGEKDHKSPIEGFNFEDSRLMKGNWLKEPKVEDIVLFFRILAVCHTAIPELNEETGAYTYEAESPDEGVFLVAAREFGFEFFQRTQSCVIVREKYTASGKPIDRDYKILNVLEFTSKRKRMTVIARDEDGQILLMCKGAVALYSIGCQRTEDCIRQTPLGI